MALVKKRVIVSDNSSDEQYAHILTPYAFRLVCKQKEQMMKVKIAEDGTVNSFDRCTLSHCRKLSV